MRTTLDVDEKLLDAVVNATGEKSKSKAVNKVLQEYMRRKSVEELIAAAGTFPIDDVRAESWEAEKRRQKFLDDLR